MVKSKGYRISGSDPPARSKAPGPLDHLGLNSNVTTRLDAVSVAGKIVTAFDQPFQLACTLWTVTASVGIALFPDHGGDAVSLIKRADAAMYGAKRAGRNGYRVVE